MLVDVQVPVTGKLRIFAPSFAWKILGKRSRGAEIALGRLRIKLWPAGASRRRRSAAVSCAAAGRARG